MPDELDCHAPRQGWKRTARKRYALSRSMASLHRRFTTSFANPRKRMSGAETMHHGFKRFLPSLVFLKST